MDVEAFVQEYLSYTSDTLRNQVLIRAYQQLDAGQFTEFTQSLGLTPEQVSRAAAGIEPVQPRQETTGEPQPGFQPTEQYVETGPNGQVVVANPAQVRAQQEADRAAGRTTSEEIVEESTQASRQSAREAQAERKLTPEQARQELYATLKSVEILRQLGIPTGDVTTSILNFYKGRPQTLTEAVYQLRAEGASDSDIAVFLTQQATGSPIQITRVEPMLASQEYRNVWVPELNKFVYSNMPGLVDANGYLLMGEDGKPVNSYDVSQAAVVLNDLPNEVRWATLDRLQTLGILMDWSPAGQENAFGEILTLANEKGRQWDVLLDMLEAEQGVSNGRDQRGMRPSRFAEGSPMGDAIQSVAIEVLGRGLTEAEKRSIYAEYKMMETKFPLYVRSARGGEGGIPTESGEVLSIDTITENWLEQNKPEEVKNTRRLGVYSQLRQAALDGVFDE